MTSPIIRRYAWGVVLPCLVVSAIGLYLLRRHELFEAVSSSQHLVDSLGQDLESEIRSLVGQVRSLSAAAVIAKSQPTEKTPLLKFYTTDYIQGDSGPVVAFVTSQGPGIRESKSFVRLRNGAPGFFLHEQSQRSPDRVVEVSLQHWAQKVGLVVQPGVPLILAILPEVNMADPPVLVLDQRFAEGRRADPALVLAAVSRVETGREDLLVEGESYVSRFHKVSSISVKSDKFGPRSWARLVILIPHEYLYRQWWRSFWLVLTALTFITVAGPLLILGGLRRQFNGLQQVLEETRGIGKGKIRDPALHDDGHELAAIAGEFRGMAYSLAEQQLRARTSNRVIAELSECSDQKAIIARAVELIGTQCRAQVTAFVPASGSTAVLWHEHKLIEVEVGEVSDLISAHPSNQRLTFQIRPGPATLGFITAVFADPLNELIESLTHLVFGQIDNALSRLATLSQMIDEKSKSRLLNYLDGLDGNQSVSHAKSTQIATYQRSVDGHPIGWVDFIECGEVGCIFTLGNLKVDNLLARIVATNIRASIRSIAAFVREVPSFSEKEVQIVNEVLASVLFGQFNVPKEEALYLVGVLDNKSGELTILNFGFPDPLFVTQGVDGNRVEPIPASNAQLKSINLSDNSAIVFHSDSINGANNLRAGVFNRLLQRGLQQTTVPVFQTALLRDEIVALWAYYAQQASGDEQVQFLCVSSKKSISDTIADGSGSAA